MVALLGFVALTVGITGAVYCIGKLVATTDVPNAVVTLTVK
jgi:hypothetical protein